MGALVGSQTKGARFGSAISNVGDLDRDGYNGWYHKCNSVTITSVVLIGQLSKPN